MLSSFLDRVINDPPDPNYADAFKPVVPSWRLSGSDQLTGRQAAILQRSIDLKLELLAVLQAALITMERIGGATMDGNDQAGTLQARLLSEYNEWLKDLISETASAEVEVGRKSDSGVEN